MNNQKKQKSMKNYQNTDKSKERKSCSKDSITPFSMRKKIKIAKKDSWTKSKKSYKESHFKTFTKNPPKTKNTPNKSHSKMTN